MESHRIVIESWDLRNTIWKTQNQNTFVENLEHVLLNKIFWKKAAIVVICTN